MKEKKQEQERKSDAKIGIDQKGKKRQIGDRQGQKNSEGRDNTRRDMPDKRGTIKYKQRTSPSMDYYGQLWINMVKEESSKAGNSVTRKDSGRMKNKDVETGR